jgi:hypothetical protein
MKEYYRLYDSPLPIPYTSVAGTVSISYSLIDINTNEEFATGNAVNSSSTQWSINLTKEEAKYDRSCKLSLSINDGSVTLEENYLIKIVRPYATPSEIATALDLTIVSGTPAIGTEITQARLERLEKYARAYINTNIDYFYFENKYINSFGQDSDAINFTTIVKSISKIYEDELIVYNTLESLNEFELSLIISPSKYQIKFVDPGDYVHEWVQSSVLPSPIAFKKNRDYKFYGEFGWEFLPDDINYAAILLVNEYLCSDYNYKARGIESISNDAFNVKYSGSAMSGSGNSYIDSILSPYKKLDFLVV